MPHSPRLNRLSPRPAHAGAALALGCFGLAPAHASIIPTRSELVFDGPTETGERLMRWEGLASGERINIARNQTVDVSFAVTDRFRTTSPDALFETVEVPRLGVRFTLTVGDDTFTFDATDTGVVLAFADLVGGGVEAFEIERTSRIGNPFADPASRPAGTGDDGFTLGDNPFVFISPYLPLTVHFNAAAADFEIRKSSVPVTVLPEPASLGLLLAAAPLATGRPRRAAGR